MADRSKYEGEENAMGMEDEAAEPMMGGGGGRSAEDRSRRSRRSRRD